MGKLSVFNFTTLNGFYKGPNEDISWHEHGGEESEYAAEGANSESTLLLGRITYQMMVAYWPTALAYQNMPDVAKGMNNSEKIVFSRTLKEVKWKNTRLIKNNIVEAVKKLKETSETSMTILGSGSIITQFAEANLIDEYQIMVDPVAIGKGTPMFKNMRDKLSLKLENVRTFKSGVLLLLYKPLKK